MIDTKTLCIGQHIFAGSIYKGFSIPKHIAQIVMVGDGYIECVTDKEQGDPDEYSDEEIEGLPIDASILERFGFKKSNLREDRWFRNDADTRITYDSNNKIITADGEEQVTRTGVRFVHEIEAVLMEAKINLTFDI